MNLPAGMQEAQDRWNKHTRFVVSDKVLERIRTVGMKWAYANYHGERVPAIKLGNNIHPSFIFLKNEYDHIFSIDVN
jgi:hypothetical protein